MYVQRTDKPKQKGSDIHPVLILELCNLSMLRAASSAELCCPTETGPAERMFEAVMADLNAS